MSNLIQLKRGVKSNLPVLSDGEPGWCTDTFEFYIGQSGASKLVGEASFLKLTGGSLSGALTLNADPTSALHAATKQYVDSLASGLDPKASVRVATDGELPACTAAGSGVGKTLTGDANGVLTVDGITTELNDRILVKDQSTESDNGIYKVTTEGASDVAFVLTRATDADEDDEVTGGMYCFVEEGTANSDAGFVLTTDNPITVDTTSLAFAQFSGAGSIVAGDGLTKSGNTLNAVGTADRITVNADSLDIASTYVGQNSITTLGTITTGVWEGTTIAANKGGTGQTAFTVGDIMYADSSSTLAKLADVGEGNVLISGGVGVAPSYGKVALGSHISGVLSAANGGTGVANDAASTLTISGAYATTLNLTDTTNLTLPTSGTVLSDNSTIDGGSF